MDPNDSGILGIAMECGRLRAELDQLHADADKLRADFDDFRNSTNSDLTALARNDVGFANLIDDIQGSLPPKTALAKNPPTAPLPTPQRNESTRDYAARVTAWARQVGKPAPPNPGGGEFMTSYSKRVAQAYAE